MKTYLKNVIFIGIIIMPLVLSGQNENHDAIYIKLEKEYTLNPDGSTDYRYIKEQRLLNYVSINYMYGETFIVYNPEHQSLKINEAYTTMADGKLVKTPANAFNEVLPGFASHAPAFNMLREMVITHTGLEQNAVIYLDYQLHSEKGFYPALMGEEILANSQPIDQLIIRIKVPTEKPLFFKTFQNNTQPEKSIEGDFSVYCWIINKIPAISQENHQLEDFGSYPRLVFSTENKPGKLFSFIQQQTAFAFALNEEMKKTVTGIVEEAKEKLAISLKIQDFIVKDFNLIRVPENYLGYQIRTPEQVWNSNGGTPLEKAILFVALLREAGITAEPVFVYNKTFWDESIATLDMIRDYLVKVQIPGKGDLYLSIDELNAYNLFYTLSNRVLVTLSQKDSYETVNTGFSEGTLLVSGNFVIDSANLLTGDVSVQLTKACNPFFSLERDKSKAKFYCSGGVTASGIKNVQISELDPEVSAFTLEIYKESILKKDTIIYTLVLPSWKTGAEGWGISWLYRERETPLELPSSINEAYEFYYTIPESFALLSPEQNLKIHHESGTFRFVLEQKNNRIYIKKSLTINQTIHNSSHYQEIKTLLDHWNSRISKEILFRKKSN